MCDEELPENAVIQLIDLPRRTQEEPLKKNGGVCEKTLLNVVRLVWVTVNSSCVKLLSIFRVKLSRLTWETVRKFWWQCEGAGIESGPFFQLTFEIKFVEPEVKPQKFYERNTFFFTYSNHEGVQCHFLFVEESSQIAQCSPIHVQNTSLWDVWDVPGT